MHPFVLTHLYASQHHSIKVQVVAAIVAPPEHHAPHVNAQHAALGLQSVRDNAVYWFAPLQFFACSQPAVTDIAPTAFDTRPFFLAHSAIHGLL